MPSGHNFSREYHPGQGEKAALHALANLDFARVRQLLEGPEVGADFRALVEERLNQSVARQNKHFVVSALLSGNAYDHYARLARLQGASISAVVAAAVERDFAGARALQQLDAEPILPTLITYLRELIELLRRSDDEPDFTAKLGRLVELQARLEEDAIASRAGERGVRGSEATRNERAGTLRAEGGAGGAQGPS